MTRSDEVWLLADRRDFLRRSLEDARREHAAGDLSDDDYDRLRRRDEARLRQVEADLARAGGDGPGSPEEPAAVDPAPVPAGRRGGARRLVLLVVGLAAVTAGAVILVVHLTAPSLPGQTPTGGISVAQAPEERAAQQLAQAEQLVAQGDDGGALTLFGDVLARYPDQPEALTEEGWLLYQSGSQSKTASLTRAGAALVARAVAIDPGFGPARLYEGVILQHEGHAAEAVAQFGHYLAGRPPASQVRTFESVIEQAYRDAGDPAPGSLGST